MLARQATEDQGIGQAVARMVAFDITEFDAVYDLVRPPCSSPEARVRMAFVADPAGNLIELCTGQPQVYGPAR